MCKLLFFAFAGLAILVQPSLAASVEADEPGAVAFAHGDAAAGARTYAARCAACHGAALKDGVGPLLKGPLFVAKWLPPAHPESDLLDQLARMPPTEPGSLSEQQRLDLARFLVEQNSSTPSTATAAPAPATGVIPPEGFPTAPGEVARASGTRRVANSAADPAPAVQVKRGSGLAVGAVKFTLPPAGSGKPFGSTSIDLPARGYVEEEFLVSGNGNRYRLKDPQSTAEWVDGGHPYTTRILVRRPTDPAKFNGIVLVEWFNVSGGQDIDFLFAAIRNHLIDADYAWVGVSVQAVGANTLKVADPTRYASISVAASNDDPKGGQLDAPTGPPGAEPTNDVLSWDIMTQVGAALRKPVASGPSPLGNLEPKIVIASGESQSAFRLTNYYNAILPLYPDVFDGVFTYDRVMAPQRSDMKIPHLSIGTEAFVSPPPEKDNLRLWEVAGASHVSYDEVTSYLDEQVLRSKLLLSPEGKPATLTGNNLRACKTHPVLSRVTTSDVLDAGLEALVTWIRDGKAPPRAPRMTRDSEGKLVRDGEGHTTGGVRLAAVDAPMASNTGFNTGEWFCGIIGSHIDYTPEEMCRRYGSTQNYLAKVTEVSRRLQSQGFLLKVDADRTIREAGNVAFTCK